MDLIIYCPACAGKLKGKRSGIRRNLSFICKECSVQILFQSDRGLSRFLAVRQEQAVFYRWVICLRCNIAVNQDFLLRDRFCPGCGMEMTHGLDGSEEYSKKEVEEWKSKPI